MTSATLATVIEALEYAGAEGLVTADSADVEAGREYAWHEARDKLGLDAAYFHGNIPIVYFRELLAVDEDYLIQLHRRLWNHNRAPLLVAVLPHEVRVYNCFAPPRLPSDQLTFEDSTLLKTVRQVTDVLALRRGLTEYRRQEVESGQFGRTQVGRFRRDKRVDRRLLDNLGHVRSLLIKDGLDKPVADDLLGRSIFVRYLEDRGVIDSAFFTQFSGGRSFRNLLSGSQEEVYELFGELARRFNGDLFPVEGSELEQVKPRHLQLLGRFLGGEEMLSGQMYFWAYDFNYIPIELISSIYETFLGEEQKGAGAYYTPPEIVDFVLNEVLPPDGGTENVKILDPACGSGIFLVEAYRRLVIRRYRARGGKALSFQELRDLLTECIDGVDVNENAVRVAAFSCYLALLDFLEPKSIWAEVRFPKLKGSNLFVRDFFDLEAPFNTRRYSLIVGNPPWQSRLSEEAAEYVDGNRVPVGDRQSAQAFLWRAPKLLAEGGKVCLLAPSKGMLFNQSRRNREFRRLFFRAHRVTKLVDFSTFRRTLFRRAVAPMVAVFYEPGDVTGNASDELVYCSPHPSPLADSLAGVVISGDEVKTISRRQAIAYPSIWKTALWGTARDFILLDDLRDRFPSLLTVAQKRKWLIGEGLQVEGGEAHHAPEQAEMRYVPVEALESFELRSKPQERIGTQIFHRPRNLRLFQGPHTLIRGGPVNGGYLAAAFVADDAVFKDGIIGVAGPSNDADELKVLCAVVNSSLARYYHFLTASTWGVERDVVRLNEHLTLPCAIPLAGNSESRELASFVDHVQSTPSNLDWRAHLDELVFEAYGLVPAERQLIADTLTFTIDQFYRGTRSWAFDAPSTEELVAYALAYEEVFEATVGAGNRTLIPTVFHGTAPYRAISFHLMPRITRSHRVSIASEYELDELLQRLERMAVEQHSRSMYLRRNVKVFERDAIHIVKPAERRFWTQSSAYNDADETIAQLLRAVLPGTEVKAAHIA